MTTFEIIVVQSLSRVQLFDTMDCSTPGFPIFHHRLPEFAQVHMHWVHDAIQPSHIIPFFSCFQSFSASVSFPMNQLFTSGGRSTGASASASVLPMNIQGWSPLGWTGWIPLLSKGLSRVFSSTTVRRHQFFGAQHFWLSGSYIHTWLLEKIELWLYGPLEAKECLCFLIHCIGLSLLFFQGAVSFTFVAAVTLFPLFPHLFAMRWWIWMLWS